MALAKEDETPDDEKAAPTSRRIGLIQMASALIVIVVLVAAYAITVSNRLDQVDKHNLRTLVKMGGSIETIIQNSNTTIKSLKKKDYVCEFFKRQSRLELAGSMECGQLQGIFEVGHAFIDQINMAADTLAVEAAQAQRVEFSLAPTGLMVEKGLVVNVEVFVAYEIKRDPRENKQLNDRILGNWPEQVKLRVNLPEILEATSFGAAFQSVIVAAPDGQVVHQHRPPSQALFGPPGQQSEIESDSIEIGNLNYLPLTKQPPKLKDKLTPTVFARISDATSVNDITLAGSPYTLMCQPLKLEYLFKRGERVSGSQEESEADSKQAKDWRICGLVDNAQSVRRSLEVASPLAIAMFAFVLIGILGWPIVKLVTMQTRERMRFIELYVAMLSTIAILMLGTVLLLNTDRAVDVHEASMAQLETLAKGLDRNLHGEFKQARMQLRALDMKLVDELGSLASSGVCSTRSELVQKAIGESCELPLLAQNLLQGSASESWLRPAEYPYLTQAFWMRLDDDGKQVIKATVREANTPAVSVSRRDYFKAVKERKLWTAAAPDCVVRATDEEIDEEECAEAEYFVQSFSSMTTGEFSAALSMPSKLALRKKGASGYEFGTDDEASVKDTDRLGVVLSLRPLSVMYPVLAPGVGFAVIDNKTGIALFHSDDRHATVENLLKDEGIADRLKAAIRSSADAHFSGLYRTRPHRIYVRPMSPEPWSIVVFSDAEISRTSNLEALSLAIMLISAHLLVFGVVTGIYLMIKGRDTPGWTWPMAHWEHTNRIAFYRGGCHWLMACGLAMVSFVCLLSADHVLYAVMSQQVAVILVLLLLGFWRQMGQGSAHTIDRTGWWAFVIVLVVSAIFIAIRSPWWLVAMVIIVGAYLLIPSRFWNYRLWGYRACFTLVWLVVAIPPSVGYYKYAHNRDLRVLSELEADYSQRAQMHREESLRRDTREFAGADQFSINDEFRQSAYCLSGESQPVDTSYIATARDCYRVSDVQLTYYLQAGDKAGAMSSAKHSETLAANIKRTLNRHLPIYNEMTSYSRYRDLPGSPLPDSPQINQPNQTSAANDGNDAKSGMQYRMPFGSVTVVGGIVMLLLLWAWASYGARRLFYGELDPHTSALKVDDIVAHNVRRHTIATLATRAQYAFLAEDSSRHWLYDLSQPASLDALENLEGDELILCTHLGDALRNDKLRLRVLSLLERLAQRTQGNVIVVTSVPIGETRSSETSESQGDDAEGRPCVFPFKADGESARWCELLTHFQLVDVSIHGNASSRMCNKTSLTQLPDKTWLACELDAIAGLRAIMGPDHEETLTQPLTRREIIKEISRRAKWFYQSLWDNCSSDEKLVLTQLSREGVVNPREVNAVRSLLARGLLRMDPVLKPINNSFGRFVASAYDLAEVQRLESRGQSTGLNKRSILLGLILLVLLFLWFTQRDVVETWIAYAGAIAVGMSAVLRMMDSLKGGGQQR